MGVWHDSGVSCREELFVLWPKLIPHPGHSNPTDAPSGMFFRASAPDIPQTFAFWVPNRWARRVTGCNGSSP